MRFIFKLLFILFFIGIIGFIAIAIYVTLNQPIIEEISYRSVLIDAKDKLTGEIMITNFTITGNNTILKEATTRDDSYVKVDIPSNYNILKITPNHKDYYWDDFTISGNKHSILLDKIGNISINHTGELKGGYGNIILDLSTDNINKEISACLRWSNNVVEVTNEYYPKVRELRTKLDCEYEGYIWNDAEVNCNFWCRRGLSEPNTTIGYCDVDFLDVLPPERLKNDIDRCYYIKRNIEKGLPFKITFNYKAYMLIEDSDFIKVYIIDSDLRNGKMVFEDINKQDVGTEDLVYEIR